MSKTMYSITKNGQCAKHLCEIDENNKTVSTKENSLVFDFSCLDDWSFKTGFGCTFTTDSGCTFITYYDCTFITGYGCTFSTGYGCTFKTRSDCTFSTGSDCTFSTEENCVLLRKDIFEIIELQNANIKLNGDGIVGYTTITEKDTEGGN